MITKLLEIINTILQNRGKAKLEGLNPKMHLRNDIGFDSLDLAELTVRIEAQFDIDIFDDGIVSTIEEVLSKLDNE